MGGSLLAVLAALILFTGAAALSPAPARAADLFLTGEREIYLAVDKLNAMGRPPARPPRTPLSASPSPTSSGAGNEALVPKVESDRDASYNEASRVVRCFT